MFTSTKGRYKHKKHVKCVPPPPQEVNNCAPNGPISHNNMTQSSINGDVTNNKTINTNNNYNIYVMGDDREWEFREFEDVRDIMIKSVSKYLEMCEQKRTEFNIKFTNTKEMLFIKGLGYKLLSLGGEIPDELEQDGCPKREYTKSTSNT
jgi:hypothetical protein